MVLFRNFFGALLHRFSAHIRNLFPRNTSSFLTTVPTHALEAVMGRMGQIPEREQAEKAGFPYSTRPDNPAQHHHAPEPFGALILFVPSFSSQGDSVLSSLIEITSNQVMTFPESEKTSRFTTAVSASRKSSISLKRQVVFYKAVS